MDVNGYVFAGLGIGAITFIGAWIGATLLWGFPVGFALGWVPSLLLAFIAGVAWPFFLLVYVCLVAFLVVSMML